jgi:N-sulfoglucosamine sulfohydrolase
MSYPMRYVRSSRYKLIHNLNYWAPFPIDQDFYISPTFQDLLQRTLNNQTLNWYKSSLKSYYQRPEFEFFDLKTDPEEKFNIAKKPRYQV